MNRSEQSRLTMAALPTRGSHDRSATMLDGEYLLTFLSLCDFVPCALAYFVFPDRSACMVKRSLSRGAIRRLRPMMVRSLGSMRPCNTSARRSFSISISRFTACAGLQVRRVKRLLLDRSQDKPQLPQQVMLTAAGNSSDALRAIAASLLKF